tara:strand:- start:630 stop:1976 length:1347 start_codon:yes stop_codon:yes gene_type:complete
MRYREIIKERTLQYSSSTSLPAYIDHTNNLLKANKPLKMGANGKFIFQPNPGQQIVNLQTPIAGQGQDHTGKEVTSVMAKDIAKGTDYEAARTGKSSADRISNRGNVTEGLFGVAMAVKLAEGRRGPVTVNQLIQYIRQLPKKGPARKAWTVPESESKITDTIALTIALNPLAYADFRDVEKISRLMQGELSSVVSYVNDSDMDRYMRYFDTNQRPDIVHVIADGISNETGSKVDVMMQYKDDQGIVLKKNFDLSVKTGATAQIGQVGGGAQKQSIEERFEPLRGMWARFGVDISPIKDEFANAKDILSAYQTAYIFADRVLQIQLKGQNQEKESQKLQDLVHGIKYFGTLNDDRVKLVQFTTNGYYVLNFKHLNKLYENQEIDLDSRIVQSKSGLPKIQIFDKNSNKQNILITVRMKVEDGYIRNYIEKGELLKELTTVRTNIKKKK